MFIDANILNFENIIFDFQNKKLFIDNCKIIVLITCISFKSRINRNINIFVVIVLLTFAVISVSFKFKNVFKLLQNKDFLFQFHIIFIVNLNIENEIIIYILNADIAVMHV